MQLWAAWKKKLNISQNWFSDNYDNFLIHIRFIFNFMPFSAFYSVTSNLYLVQSFVYLQCWRKTSMLFAFLLNTRGICSYLQVLFSTPTVSCNSFIYSCVYVLEPRIAKHRLLYNCMETLLKHVHALQSFPRNEGWVDSRHQNSCLQYCIGK